MRKTWKKAVSIGCATCMLIGTIPAAGITAMAETLEAVTQSNEELASGYWGSCRWSIKENGVLTISGGIGESTPADGNQYGLWNYYNSWIEQIKKIKITGDIIFVGDNISLKNLFAQCRNVKEIIGFEKIDTSKVTDMRGLFQRCSKLKKVNLSNLDMSKVTDMSYMFSGCQNLQGVDINTFDTGNVTNMSGLFANNQLLNDTDISKLDTSNVTDMSYMFASCSQIEDVDLSKLDTGNVTNMSHMFFECSELETLDVSVLDTSNVTDMSYMFSDCVNLENLDVSKLDTSNVSNMSGMFMRCSLVKKLDLSSFDTSKVTDMSDMFFGCRGLSKIDMSGWDVSNLEKYSDIFSEINYIVMPDKLGDSGLATEIKSKMSNEVWYDMTTETEYDKVPDSLEAGHIYMKKSVYSVLKDLDTQISIQMEDGSLFNVDDEFEVKNVTDDEEYAKYITLVDEKGAVEELYDFSLTNDGENIQPDGKIRVSIPVDFDYYAGNSAKIYYIEGDGNVTEMDVKYEYGMTDDLRTFVAEHMGIYAVVITSENSSGTWGTCDWNIENGVLTISGGTAESVSYTNFPYKDFPWKQGSFFPAQIKQVNITGNIEFDEEKVDIEGMFSGYVNLREIQGLEKIDTSRVTNMSWMFKNCGKLQELNVSNFNTGNVTDMSNMFYGCSKLQELDVSSFDTSSVTNMSSMFRGCYVVQELDVSSFDTSSVTNMSSMFLGCYVVQELDVSSFDTSNVTDISYMFYGCNTLQELDVSSLDTGNVTNMSHMFTGCSNIQKIDVSNFDTGNVTDMSYMFNGCEGIQVLDLSNFNTNKVEKIQYMISECPSLKKLDMGGWKLTNISNVGVGEYQCFMVADTALDYVVMPDEMNDNPATFIILNQGSWYDATSEKYFTVISQYYGHDYSLQCGHTYLNKDIYMTKADEDTDISVKMEDGSFFDDNVTLEVVEADENEDYTDYIETAEKLGFANSLYDITLKKDDAAVQPDGNVVVTIPLPDDMSETSKVYHIAEDGTATDMNAEYADGNLVFVTDHFSVYAVVDDSIQPGDINGDGKITMQDSALLRRYLAGWAVEVNESVADVNGDGKVTMQDSALLRRYLAGWDVTLG